MAEPRGQQRKRSVTITLEQEMFEQLEREADEQVRTVEQQARYMIKQAFSLRGLPQLNATGSFQKEFVNGEQTR